MVIEKFEVEKEKYGITQCTSKIFTCLVAINASESIKAVINEINDESWIAKLGIIERTSYEARAIRTVEKIMKECVKFNNSTKENEYDYSVVGEYIVSREGRGTLISEFQHTHIPLAELWKEKSSGNPGFDYHSESTSNRIIFGEAKYNSLSNPYNEAIGQVEDFIEKGKDKMELSDIKHFVTEKAVDNFLDHKKGFAVSFSVKAVNPCEVIKNAICSELIDKIKQYDEFYIIGVIINDK